MRIGRKIGCHQRPDRSFFFRGYQFPLCARCTGILIGYLFAIIWGGIFQAGYLTCLILTVPMLIDGGTQYLKMRESTQILRMITGVIGGFGLMSLQMKFIVDMLM